MPYLEISLWNSVSSRNLKRTGQVWHLCLHAPKLPLPLDYITLNLNTFARVLKPLGLVFCFLVFLFQPDYHILSDALSRWILGPGILL
jgi:hypothetical protein